MKPFPGATTEDIEAFIKSILRKEPKNIIIHVGTNDVNSQEPRLTAEGIVNLALQIEGDGAKHKHSYFEINFLGGWQREKRLKCQQNPQKILPPEALELYWTQLNVNLTNLNRGRLHLSKSEIAF